MKKNSYFFIILLVLAGSLFGMLRMFQYAKEDVIRISTNPWIGFTPFVYAQEKGWLEETPFKFIWLVDLSDNARLFEKQFVEGFTATQYEFLHFKDKNDLTTVFLIDQSYGADAVLSNRSVDALRQTHEKINVYLEMGSFNQDMLGAFITENNLDKNKFVLIDSSQKSMEAASKSNRPIVMVTYEPYISKIKANGFHVIASTRTLKTVHVVDALFAKESSLEEHHEEYEQLKHIFDRALAQMRKDPKEFYITISGYLEGQSYDDFLLSAQNIKWIDNDIPVSITKTFHQQNIPMDKLLQ